MGAPAHNPPTDDRIPSGIGIFAWLAVGVTACGVVGAIALMDLPAPLLMAIPFLAAGGLLILAHTPTALCVIAFSILPLGIIQVELGIVTVSLPETLILLLFAKELLLFLLRSEKPNRDVPWSYLTLYLGIGALGLPIAMYYGNGLVPALQDARQFLEFIVLYLLVMHRVQDRSLIKKILAAYVAGATLIALHGIVERFTGFGIPATQLVSDRVYHDFVRSGSVYGATALGALMVLALGPALGLILSSKNLFTKISLSGVCVILLVAAVFTNTRASWLAIAIMLLFIFVSIRKKPGLIIATVIGALVFSMVLGPVVYKRMAMLEVSKKERSLMERVQYYTTAWHIFRSHPTFGLGWGSYYDQKTILSNGRYVKTKPPKLPEHVVAEAVTVHSAYLQILVKTGLAGLLTFFIVLAHWGMCILRERRAKPRDELDHNLYVGLTGALIGYLLHATGENFFQWPVMSQTFWMFLALSTLMAAKIVRDGNLGVRATPAGE